MTSFICSLFYVCFTYYYFRRQWDSARENEREEQRPPVCTIQKKRRNKIRNLWLWLVGCSLLPACNFHRPFTMTKHMRIFGKRGTWINLLVGSKNKQAHALIYLWFLLTKGNIHKSSEFSRQRGTCINLLVGSQDKEAHVSLYLWVYHSTCRFSWQRAHVSFCLWVLKTKRHMYHSKFKDKEAPVSSYLWFSSKGAHESF